MIPYGRIVQPEEIPMKVATLAIMVRRKKVLLGLKRGGPEVGEGTFNGPGGKLEKGESLVDCLWRETWEEIRIRIHRASAKKIAVITFFAGGVADFEVHVYLITRWKGMPLKTASMIPSWHCSNRLPLQRMLSSDRTWFERAVRGNTFHAQVFYRKRAKGFLGITFLPFTN